MILPNTFPVKAQFTPKQDTTPFGGVLAFLKILCDRKILHCLPGDRMQSQGWLDAQMVLSIMLLNILGFDRVADIKRLEENKVLCKTVRRLEPLLFGRRHATISARLRRETMKVLNRGYAHPVNGSTPRDDGWPSSLPSVTVPHP